MSDTDRRDITATLVAYATAIDTKDWALFRSVFADDCVFDGGGHRMEGVEQLTEHMRVLHEPLDRSLHHLGNFVIDVDGATARAKTYLDAVLVQRNHPTGPMLRVTGSYDDALIQRAGRWVISRRTFRFLWHDGNLALAGS